jgi:iron complex outermembrane receptor protein
MNQSILFFLNILLLFSSFLFGQEDSVEVFRADPIIINATRSEQPLFLIPYATETLKLKEIQQGKKLISLEETLQSVPGIFVNNRNNFSLGDRISIRGVGSRSSFGVRGLKLIIDEIPLTMADGQSQLNNIDLSTAGEIDIIKGPGASLFGNAAGGIIQIHTMEIEGPGFIEPQMVVGSYGLFQMRAKAGLSMENGNYLFSVNRLNSKGYREHSTHDSWLVNTIGRNELADNLKLTSVLNYYYAPFSLNPGSLDKRTAKNDPRSGRDLIINQGAGEKTEQAQAGITLKYVPSSERDYKITVFGLLRSVSNPIPSDIIELQRKAGGIRFSSNYSGIISGFKFNFTGGIDGEVQFDNREEFENEGLANMNIARRDILQKINYGEKVQHQDEDVITAGPFAKISFELHNSWHATLGGRYDFFQFEVDDHLLTDGSDDSGKRKFTHFSPMLGLVWLPSKWTSVYANYSTAFHTPTTSEFSNLPDGQGGINPSLNPELINSFEIGLKGILPSFNIFHQSAVYYMRYTDMLISFQNSLTEKVYYRNAGSSENIGFETMVSWRPNTLFSANISYSALRFVFSDYVVDSVNIKGNNVPGVAPNRVFASLKYDHPQYFFLELRLTRVGKYFANDFNGPQPGSDSPQSNFLNEAYTTMDISGGKTFKLSELDINVNVGIDNLLDTRYNGSVIPNAFGSRFYEPSPGRTWYGGAQLHF